MWEEDWMSYFCWGREICPTTGRQHFQGYLETKVRIVGRALVAKETWEDVHVEVRLGTGQQAADYCFKVNQDPPCEPNEEWVEYGELMKQGARADLAQIGRDVLSGAVSARELLRENPMIIHQYGRTINALEDLRQSETSRGEWAPPEVKWFHGKSGAGKSRTAREEAKAVGGPIYVHTYTDTHFFTRYRGEKLIIFDEFRGQMPFYQFLGLLDGYETWVDKKCRDSVPWMATHIWITSRRRPDECWKEDVVVEEDMIQLFRRLTEVRFFAV